MLKLSQRVDTLRPSATLEIAATAQTLKSQGYDVISLAVGEPDFPTPDPIQRAATQAMVDGITRYTPSNGFLALRQAIATKVSKENNFPVSPEEVVVTCGAKHAIYLALQCLIDPGDSVLLPTPAWVSYGSIVELAGGSVVLLPMLEEDGFRPNVDRWKGLAIPSNVKGIIINSPCNPTGVVYTKEDIVRLIGWALQRNLWILSDEIYEKILFEGSQHYSLASIGPEAKSHTITVSGFSKSYCMTGWRVGWSIAESDLIRKMSDLQSQSTSNVTSIAQMAAIAATKMSDAPLNAMVEAFAARRKYCMQRLESLSNDISYVKPMGAFYFFLNLSNWLTPRKMSDVDFCKELLNKYHLGLVPGSSFGNDKFVRMSYAVSEDTLKRAFDRLEAYLH